MRRFLTTLAFSANAIAFGAIAAAAIVASHGHAFWGNMTSAATMLGIGVVTLLVMLASALPTSQDNLLRWLASPAGRILGRITALFLILVTIAVADAAVLQRAAPILGVIRPGHVILALLVYALLMILAFVVPGLAYPRRERPVRAVERPASSPAREVPSHSKPASARADHGPADLPVPAAVSRRNMVFIVLIFAPLALTYYGFAWAWFLPSPEHSAWIEDWRPQLTLAGLLGAFVGALQLQLKAPTGFLARRPRLQRAGFVLVCTLFGTALSPALERGLPALHSLIMTAPATTTEVIVVAQGPLWRRNECGRTVEVAFPEAAAPAGLLCEVPPAIRDAVRPGDRLLLTGYRTAWGFRYTAVSRP